MIIIDPDYQSVLAFQVSLYDKAAPFGTITKCVDYAGVLVFKCPHQQVCYAGNYQQKSHNNAHVCNICCYINGGSSESCSDCIA